MRRWRERLADWLFPELRLAFTVALIVLSPLAFAGIPQGNNNASPASNDQATSVLSGSFTGTGQSGSFAGWPQFNVVFGGSSGPNGNYSATIRLERSFDGGTTWYVAGVGGSGTQAIYSTANQDVSLVVSDPEKGVLYRLNVTAYTSGTINYRFSTTSPAQTSFP